MPVSLHVVTPCLNVAATIDRTIISVITQAGPFRLTYHVQDGGSSDDTVEKLEGWARRIASGNIPRQCAGLRFSHSSSPDEGMYDALANGIARLGAGHDDFLTWINADDILMPGALALAAEVARQFRSNEVSWFGGPVAILQGDLPITIHDRVIPTAALRAGLCDGEHWEFLQQEGTFFRHWLWEAVEPRRSIVPMRLAGDWNLWRLFAHEASLVQTEWPLGCFRLRDGQLSTSQRARYMEEIDALVPVEARRAGLQKLGSGGQLGRRRMSAHYPLGPFYVVEENVVGKARERHERVFGEPPDWSGAAPLGRRSLFEGMKLPPAAAESPEETVARALVRRRGLVAFDRDWQFPAVTERHAFARMAASAATYTAVPEAAVYVGYPWATLFDKLHGRTSDAEDHLERFHAFCAKLPPAGLRVTVCQHVLLRNFLHLFEEAGIAEVFWSHATRGDVVAAEAGTAEGPRLRPFPLYPVQVPEALPSAAPEADAGVAARPHLFSFIGARPDRWYLSEVRAFILDHLAEHPLGLVIGRDSWHYQRVVYDLQVRTDAVAAAPETLVDAAASDQFCAALTDSVFALCPSGSGPNSIRLWEAIAAGAIPVILADSWAPPGDPRLWEAAAVFCSETREAVQALPERLAAIAADPGRLAALRQGMRQIWLLYGPDGFIYDVEKRMQLLTEMAPAGYLGHAVPAQATVTPPEMTAGATAAERLLLQAGRLLLGMPVAADAAAAALAEAGGTLPEGHPALSHYNRVCSHVAQQHARAPADRRAAPLIGHGAVPRIAFLGRHSHRTPLSYPPLRRAVGDRLAFVDDPARADIVLTGFNLDLRENAATFAALARRPRPPHVVVMSEEPLWDTVWSGGFTERRRRTILGEIELHYTVLNHDTSDIFAFAHIPYFLLTTDDFAPRLAALIAARAALTPQALCARWQATPLRAAFFAEARSDPRYAVAFPERDIHGLSLYRTEVARAVAAELPEGRVLCAGQGWGVAPRRQDLPDWHLDKLATLAGRVLIASAYENTHHLGYISEKIFDAFAVGGIPTYVAQPRHRVHALVPAEAMINTFGLEPIVAAQRIIGHRPELEMAEAWLVTARDLAALLGCRMRLASERRRVADICLAEIEATLSTAPA